MKDNVNRCFNCMQTLNSGFEKCPNCGYVNVLKPCEIYHLCPGTVLFNRYLIGVVIGFGGFGTIYKAWDYTLDKIVAIKEYYPTIFLNRVFPEKTVEVFDNKNVDTFEKGKMEFLDEARNLAKFNTHPNIVHVYDFFEENGTAYFVMEYLDGCNLKIFLQANTKKGLMLSVETALQITQCVLSALKAIHDSKIIHRDIKPGNVFICKDGTVKLLDLGAARYLDSDNEKTRTIIITPGYAPAEQYQIKSKQGAYTDIYAVGAVLYEILTGKKPDESINRKVEDQLVEPKKLNDAIPDNVNKAVMRAMAIQPEIRFKSVEQFSRALKKEKHVNDAKEEIYFFNFCKILKVAGLLMATIIILFICLKQYQQKIEGVILKPSDITVWVPCIEGNQEATIELMDNMTKEYSINNNKVHVHIKPISEEIYQKELEEALSKGEGPTIFESSCLTNDQSMKEINKLFDSYLTNINDYYFLDHYADIFPSYKQLPLTVDVPILYQNTVTGNGNKLNIAEASKNTLDQFLNQRAGSYVGSIGDYSEVQNKLSGIYKITYPNQNNDVQATFHNVFSINENVTNEEYEAAIRLLYYYLSETSQDYLTIQNNNYLPLNKKILKVYIDVNSDFADLEEYLEHLPKGRAK